MPALSFARGSSMWAHASLPRPPEAFPSSPLLAYQGSGFWRPPNRNLSSRTLAPRSPSSPLPPEDPPSPCGGGNSSTRPSRFCTPSSSSSSASSPPPPPLLDRSLSILHSLSARFLLFLASRSSRLAFSSSRRTLSRFARLYTFQDLWGKMFSPPPAIAASPHPHSPPPPARQGPRSLARTPLLTYSNVIHQLAMASCQNNNIRRTFSVWIETPILTGREAGAA